MSHTDYNSQMRDKDRNTYKNLIILFWADILILIGVLLRMLYLKGPDFASTPASNISFERYAIMLSLICIPSVLKLFHTYHKKISSPENNKYEQKYILIYIIRLSIFNILCTKAIDGW